MASRLSQPQARLDLLIDCYLWAFRLYCQERAHIQHCWVILCSFAWAGFAVGISDHSRKGQNPNGEPSRCRTKNMKLCNAYDIIKYAKEFEKGNTIMKNYGDPQSQMCRIGSFLSEVHTPAGMMPATVCIPCPSVVSPRPTEVVHHGRAASCQHHHHHDQTLQPTL